VSSCTAQNSAFTCTACGVPAHQVYPAVTKRTLPIARLHTRRSLYKCASLIACIHPHLWCICVHLWFICVHPWFICVHLCFTCIRPWLFTFTHVVFAAVARLVKDVFESAAGIDAVGAVSDYLRSQRVTSLPDLQVSLWIAVGVEV